MDEQSKKINHGLPGWGNSLVPHWQTGFDSD